LTEAERRKAWTNTLATLDLLQITQRVEAWLATTDEELRVLCAQKLAFQLLAIYAKALRVGGFLDGATAELGAASRTSETSSAAERYQAVNEVWQDLRRKHPFLLHTKPFLPSKGGFGRLLRWEPAREHGTHAPVMAIPSSELKHSAWFGDRVVALYNLLAPSVPSSQPKRRDGRKAEGNMAACKLVADVVSLCPQFRGAFKITARQTYQRERSRRRRKLAPVIPD
jgi:hypothetical protein